MTSHASIRNGGMLITRNELSMPKWVAEQSDRIGPKPPPPPSTPEKAPTSPKQPSLPPKMKPQEPDYEVIEFSNQQYSNTPLRPSSANSGSKTPDNKLKCTLCGSGNPWVTCEECAQQIFCASCDDMFHKHPKRKSHQRKTIEKSRPPLPPKTLPGQAGPAPPVAPPRRNKRGVMTPILQRKDQGNAMPGPFPEPTSAAPSAKSSLLQDRLGSLHRGLNLLNRPLPETPKSPSESSRSTTPKSAFDNIQRPPSVALEKIKSKANATLDRMQLLQQRYRQQKEQMERERCGSVADQNMSAFDQWSSISQSPSHFRSGSMSSGINSSHLDLTDDNNFNLFHQRQTVPQDHQIAARRANHLGQRCMSTSVFNLNQINPKHNVPNNGWMENSLQQAQSMAHLNCGNCAQSQMHNIQHLHNQLASQQQLNRSNMSLNIPAGYMMQQPMSNMYPPPTFLNHRNLMPQMYAQPYMGGMPVMNPGLICMPPTSLAPSRSGSRMASPAMSRKSVTLRRKQRSNYIDDEATDDEDSDDDDRRSITSTRSGVSRSRQRLMSSASQFHRDEYIEPSSHKLHRNRVRSQRRDSSAKSVHNGWAPERRASLINNNRSADSGFNSPLKQSRIYSDLDSEGSGTRALVQAKIEQKLKEESLKQKETKTIRHCKSPTPQKACAAVQTPALKQAVKQEKVSKDSEEVGPQTEKSSQKEQQHTTEIIKDKDPLEVPKNRSLETDEDEEECESNGEESIESDSNQENGEPEQVEEDKIEADDLGPPPSTPDHEWECEFCTFVNEPNIKICSICCKTPSVKPKEAKKSTSPPKQIKTKKVKPRTVYNTAGELKSNTIKRNPHSVANKTEASILTNNIQESTSDSPPKPNDRHQTATGSLNNKESLEDIWATLDESIQSTAQEITHKTQSKNTAKETTSASGSATKSAVEPQKKETGTTSPLQSISTQTYDTLPVPKTENKDNKPVARPAAETLYNDAIQHTNFISSPKIQDLKSFEAEVLNKIHNISHVPSHFHNHRTGHTIYSSNDRQRYRSNNDLRMDDTMSVDFEAFNGLGKRQPSISELLLLSKPSPQLHSPFGDSTYDLPYREFSSVRPHEKDNHKESDLYKYTTEELNAALKYCGRDIHPLVWLRDNWPKLIQTVQSLATKYGQERAENTIGTISQMEAREALRTHTGNIWQAVSECIEQRQRKYREICSKGNYSREDIVTALTTQQGNVELALSDLGRTQINPFLMRIWGSPGGVENESGVQYPVASPPFINMDKDIHSFLSANASECMQTPNATGAYNTNNQMPSPFDLPAPLNSPLERNSLILDKAFNYNTDTPLQLDDSILSNKNVLKDLETLIGNMEDNQQKQNEHVLRSLHEMMSNTNPKSETDYDSESMRILTKSPIISPKLKSTPKDSDSKADVDIKQFVWQHIQEIVPDLVQQVEMELVQDIEGELISQEKVEEGKEKVPEVRLPDGNSPASLPPPPPIDQDEFVMEEVIKPNIKNASIREELPPQYFYTAEIATFQLGFDKGLQREHTEEFDFETLEEATREVYKMFRGPETQPQRPEPLLHTEITTADTNKTKDGLSKTVFDAPDRESVRSHATQAINLEIVGDPLETASKISKQQPIENEGSFKSPSDHQVENRLPADVNGENLNKDPKLLAPEEGMHVKTENNVTTLLNTNQPNASNSTASKLRRRPNKQTKTQAKKTSENQQTIRNSSQDDSQKELNGIPNLDLLTSTACENPPTPSQNISSERSPSPTIENTTRTQIPAKSVETLNDNKNPNSSTEFETVALVQNIKHEAISPVEAATGNKRISKIPIRRTASNKSIISCSTIASKVGSNGDTKLQEQNLVATTSAAEANQLLAEGTNREFDAEQLPVVKSSTFATEITTTADHLPSPSSASEIFLMIQQEVSENTSTIAPSTSSSTLHSVTSQSSSFKSPTEFIPSGDPSKQNLTELVEDTQRLIKQMKDEISIDDFESSTDDGEYSDEFSDEYDDVDDEEEDWEEEEDEEEQDGDYDDITEDITEENETFSTEDDSVSNSHSALPSQESQDHRAIHNSSALSNITNSSSHSLAFLHDHFEPPDSLIIESSAVENQYIAIDETEALIPTENILPELPTEIVLNHLNNSQLEMPHDEIENALPEMPLETVLSSEVTQDDKTLITQNLSNTLQDSQDKLPVESSSTDILLVSGSASEEMDLENATMQALAPAEETPQNQSQLESKSEADSTATQYDPQPRTNTADEMPTNSIQNVPSEANDYQNKASEANDGSLPSTSTGTIAAQEKKKTNVPKTSVKKSLATSKIPKPKETAKDQKQKEIVAPEPKGNFKKKYARSKSFSGPATPIGIASVKTISQKFTGPSPSTPSMAPRKPTVTRKSSIADAINKFTKPVAGSEKHAASSLFKSRTQPRIPKKKYHETCFSDDDYESSPEEEEPEPVEVRQRKLSVPVFKAYPSIQEPENVNTDELVEKFTKQNLAATVAEAQIAAALVSMKFPQDVSLWAAKECSDLDHAIALLRQECELCSGTYALNQIVSMLKCTHKCCKQCARTYFTVQITERSINDCSCPFCKLPELHNQTEHEDENLEYFSNLDIFLKNIVEPEVHELFQRKLRDRTLLKDPNFKWCVQCSSGFFARPKQKRLICPDCGSLTCAQCRKMWQKQHEGLSCEQYAEWESANDPETQAKGVQQHLEQHGIDCPKCKFKYSLARGGCMHFTCTQCKYEFCYGCAKPFMMGAKCTISHYCAKLGLHAHHPRNCLFYLRDKLPIQLQILLKNNNVSFEVDPIAVADSTNDDEPSPSKEKEALCPMPIQKETPTGLVDTRCNGDVPEKHAGLCRNHYVEYLTAKVAKAKIDPLPIFDLTDCVQELRRRGIPLPERGPWDTDEIYKNMCAEVIQKNIPLDMA